MKLIAPLIISVVLSSCSSAGTGRDSRIHVTQAPQSRLQLEAQVARLSEQLRTHFDVETVLQRADLYHELGDHQRALEDCLEALRHDHHHLKALVNGAVAFNALGKYEESLRLGDRAIQEESDCAEAWINRGISKMCLERYDEALKDFEKASTLTRMEVLFINLSFVNDKLGFGDAAVRAISSAIELDQRRADLFFRRAELLVKWSPRSPREAMQDLDRSIALDPNDGSAHLLRAKLRLQNGDVDGAGVDAQISLKDPSTRRRANYMVGMVFLKKAEFGEALNAFNQVIEAYPNYAKAFAHRAVARLALRDVAGAVEDCGKALALDSQITEAYLTRAMANIARKQLEAAAADLDHAESALSKEPSEREHQLTAIRGLRVELRQLKQ